MPPFETPVRQAHVPPEVTGPVEPIQGAHGAGGADLHRLTGGPPAPVTGAVTESCPPDRDGYVMRSAAALMLGQAVRLAVQGGLFLLLARELGPSAFGAFAAVTAVSAMLLPFVGLGLVSVMMRDVARDPDVARRVWIEATTVTLLSGVVLVAIGVWGVVAVGFAEERIATILMLLVADTIALRVIEAAGFLWQALGRSAYLAVLPTIVNGLRLAGLAALTVFTTSVDLHDLAPIYLAASVVPGVIAAAATSRAIRGLDSAPRDLLRDRLRAGLTFAVTGGAAMVTTNADKALLAALVSSGSAGVYSAGYRVVDMAYLPIRALTSAVYPTYFRAGARGVRATVRATTKVAPLIFVYGLVTGALLYVFASQVASVLGPDYLMAADVIRALGVVVVLRGLSGTGGDVLSGADKNVVRMRLQAITAVVNVVLNLVLIPVAGITGAVVAVLFSEALLAALLWSYVLFAAHKERPEQIPDMHVEHSSS